MKHIVFIIFSFLLLSTGFGHTGICTTQKPSRISLYQAGANAVTASSCIITVCDEPSNRYFKRFKAFVKLFFVTT